MTAITPPAARLGDPIVAARAIAAAPSSAPPGHVPVERWGRIAASPHVVRIAPTTSSAATQTYRRTSSSLMPRPVPSEREIWRLGAMRSRPRYVPRASFPNRLEQTGESALGAIESYLQLIGRAALRVRAGVQRFVEQHQPIGRPSGARPLRDLLPASRVLRPVVAGAIIAAVVVLPLQGYQAVAGIRGKQTALRNAAASAETALKDAVAAANADPSAASAGFVESETAFRAVQRELQEVGFLATLAARLFPAKGKQLAAADALARAGITVSRAGRKLASGLAAAGPDTNLLYKITELRNAAITVSSDVDDAARALDELSTRGFTAGESATVGELRDKVRAAALALRDLPALLDALLPFLGGDGPRRYLIVFENNTELRPTGGFIGSFAEVTVHRGAIERLVAPPGGSYDLQGDLKALVVPPEPLRLLTGRWQFHDANWFPDFPTSARKLAWFYGQSGGTTPDGVIAVTADFLPALLGVVGPVTLPDGRLASADTVLSLIRDDIDAREGGGAAPKQIIGEIAPELLERLTALQGDELLTLGGVLQSALLQKQIMVWSRDARVAAEMRRRGWDGSFAASPGDSLALVTANIGGEKTDGLIVEEIFHDSELRRDGQAVDTVMVRRTHTGRAGIASGRMNRSYLRVYVPAGAKLLAAEGDFNPPSEDAFIGADPEFAVDTDVAGIEREIGIEPGSGTRVTEEFGQTAFGNWMTLEPGETKFQRYTYVLPERWDRADANRWTLHVWHQSGAAHRTFTPSLRIPDGSVMKAITPPGTSLIGDASVPFTHDLWFGAVVARGR